MDDIERFWRKNIEGKHLYRIVAQRYVPEIKKHGFTPPKNPYEPYEKDIIAFSRVLLRLQKKGFVMMRWWGAPKDQANVMRTTLIDLRKRYIDFTPAMRIDYYMDLTGGALAQTVWIYSEELIMKKPPLTEKEWGLVRKLNAWSKALCTGKNVTLAIKATSTYLEHAHFQHYTGPYVESPFGSLSHFRSAVKKNGLAFYRPFLTGKKLFYLRTTKPIPAKEIVFTA